MKKFAYYLPQFHEIPENNKWWGKGFTEWTAACNKMLELHPELKNDNPETLNAIVNMLKYELKRDIISGGFNYLKYAGWIAHTQKSVKNLLIYVLTIIKIYPFFVSLFYKDKL